MQIDGKRVLVTLNSSSFVFFLVRTIHLYFNIQEYATCHYSSDNNNIDYLLVSTFFCRFKYGFDELTAASDSLYFSLFQSVLVESFFLSAFLSYSEDI